MFGPSIILRRLVGGFLGAAAIWVSSAYALPLLRLAPGRAPHVDAWIALHPSPGQGAQIAVVLALVLVLLASQELERMRGMRGAVFFGILTGVVTLATRMVGTPGSLIDVAVVVAFLRGSGVFAATALMYLVRHRTSDVGGMRKAQTT